MSLFFGMHCLSFCDLRLLVNPLVSEDFSCWDVCITCRLLRECITTSAKGISLWYCTHKILTEYDNQISTIVKMFCGYETNNSNKTVVPLLDSVYVYRCNVREYIMFIYIHIISYLSFIRVCSSDWFKFQDCIHSFLKFFLIHETGDILMVMYLMLMN